MSIKQYNLPDVGTVTVRKHPQARSVRLSVDSSGSVRVSIPRWLPYAAGIEMATRQRLWIQKQLARHPSKFLEDGLRVGKAHRLSFRPNGQLDAPKTRVIGNEVVVQYPPNLAPFDASVQTAAEKAAIRILRVEAETLLPQRLKTIAQHTGLEFASVSVRQLKTRWGSCDAKKHITLNIYLMQLPWNLIDYVLVHELAHTEELNHSKRFWDIVENCIPQGKVLRRELKQHRPQLT